MLSSYLSASYWEVLLVLPCACVCVFARVDMSARLGLFGSPGQSPTAFHTRCL